MNSKRLEKIEIAVKDYVKENDIDIHDLDIEIIDLLTSELNGMGLVLHGVDERNDGECDYYNVVTYFSDTLGKNIIYNNDFFTYCDGESIKGIALAIYTLDMEIRKFESKISFNNLIRK